MPGLLRSHVREHNACHVHQAEDVRSNYLFDFVVAGLFRRANKAVSGIVHQHVDSAKGVHCILHAGNDVIFLRDVQLKREGCGRVPVRQIDDARFIARGGDHALTTREHGFSEQSTKA